MHTGSTALAMQINAVREALFPEDEIRPDGSSIDHSADGNLEAVIIDLEARGTDKTCLNTLSVILNRLIAARNALGVAE